MYKLVVIYYRVDDETALEGFYAGTHLPLMESLPELRRVEVSRVTGRPGGQSRFHLMVEAYFDDQAALEQALLSDSGRAMMEALRPWSENRLLAWFYAEAFTEDR